MARLTINSLKDVREALFDGRNSWYDIGVELDVSPATLDNIKTQFHDDADCLREMLKVWLKGLDCSWKVIVAALKSKALREKTGTLATEIDEEYCTETATNKRVLSTAGIIQEGIDTASEVQAKMRKLESEVIALRTQQRLDQGDFSSVIMTESTSKSGIDVSAKGSFIVSNNKAHVFEMKYFGLRLHIPEGALPPGVDETTVHVEVSLSGQYCIPDDSELASAVYWLSTPVKFSRPVTVEIQHSAAFENLSSKLCFTICRCPGGKQPQLPYTFEKLEGGVFSRSSRNGSIDLSVFSGLAIIMPKGGPQHHLSQLWYAKTSDCDFSAYYVITKDLAALESAVQAYYSDKAFQGRCERIEFEGEQIMMDIPMTGLRTRKWNITPVNYPVIQKQDTKSFSSGRLPVCELAIQWEGKHTFFSDVPARLTYAINLLGAKGAGVIVLDFKRSAFQQYFFKLFYKIVDDNNCDVYCRIAHVMSTYQWTFMKEIGAVEGPKMMFMFESPTVSIEISAAMSGWRIITPMPELQISRTESSDLPHHQFRVIRDPNTQEPLSMDVHLKGAKPHNNSIRLFLDPSVWDVSPMTGRQELTDQVPGNEAGPSTSRPSRGEDASPPVQGTHCKRSQKQSCGEGLESEPELSALMDQIASRIPNKWRAVGIALGLTINELSCFSANEDPSRCFTFVFTIWRSRMTRLPYSWGTVVEVLRSPSVGELKMAEQLEKRLTNQN